MFVLSVLEAPNTKTNSLCVQTHWAIKLFLILILILNHVALMANSDNKQTHTHTHVGFAILVGTLIGVMVFILYRPYILLPYTNPTPKLSPHRRLFAFLHFKINFI